MIPNFLDDFCGAGVGAMDLSRVLACQVCLALSGITLGLAHFQLIAGFGLAAMVEGFGRFLASGQWEKTILKESDTGKRRHVTYLASIMPL